MNRSFIFAILAVCLVLIEAKMILNREQPHPTYVKLHRAEPERLHDFRIALKQRNVDLLEAAALDASDPSSANYGKWWTTEQILDLIAPPKEEVEPVLAWLHENGIHSIDISGRDFIKVRTSIGVIEKIFNTEMYYYRSTETGAVVARIFGPAHIPDHLSSIIERVFGISELVPRPLTGPKVHTQKERFISQSTDPLGYVYPALLRQMYGIPSTFKVHPKSSLGVIQFEFVNVLNARSYNPADLGIFNAGMAESIHVDKIVGPFNANANAYEPTLDVEVGSAFGLNTTFWYWTEYLWMYEFATNLFNAKDYPLVVSMSYGYPESMQCTADASANCLNIGYSTYIQRCDTEFLKITMKGVTIISCSGDYGAPGDGNPFCNGDLGIFDIYPATSPWVTGVGATMLIPGGSTLPVKQPPQCVQTGYCATTGLEGVCTAPTALITTGGGFSQLHPVPTWQQSAVTQYLNSGVNFPPSNLFNPSNRGFPDISANGHDYWIAFSPYGFLQMDGTSASTPLISGMISLLNSYMLNNNKSPLGFINPLLYKMWADDPTTFTDIISGSNNCTPNCCGPAGYTATNGWDAVTGLGTPVFPKIQNYIKKNLIKK